MSSAASEVSKMVSLDSFLTSYRTDLDDALQLRQRWTTRWRFKSIDDAGEAIVVDERGELELHPLALLHLYLTIASPGLNSSPNRPTSPSAEPIGSIPSPFHYQFSSSPSPHAQSQIIWPEILTISRSRPRSGPWRRR